MGFFGSLTRSIQGLFGGGQKAPPPAAPTPAPAPGTTPPSPAPPRQEPGAAVSGSLADEQRRLKEEEADLLAGAYTGGHSGTRDPAAAKALEERKKDLESRMQAHKALEGKFKLVDAHQPGDAGNTLTKEEYEKVIKQYSDINLGKGDLSIDTAGMSPDDAKKFKEGALGDVASMLQTPDGRKMLEKLQNNVLKNAAGQAIDPATGNPVAAGGAETHRKTTIGQSASPMGATAIWGNAADAANPLKGTDSQVKYVPGADVNTTRSDVVLFHELRHALDETTGNINHAMVPATSPVAADAGKYRQYEHQAVGLGTYAGTAMTENSYRAQRAALAAAGAPGLRAGDLNMPQRASYDVLP
jgi:hypothetical protein